jgi:hypothetical protein
MISRLKNLIRDNSGTKQGAIPSKLINQCIANEDFPYLISFPRTGSHWFRMLLEQYANRPLLVRSFFDHGNKDFLLYHTHDMNLTLQRKNIIYLYRNPTDIIFSQLNYYQQDVFDKNLVHFWANQYAAHLSHWIFLESASSSKIFITYEGLKNNLSSEFKKATNFLNLDWNQELLNTTYKNTSKKTVEDKTQYNKQVMNTSKEYQEKKELFVNTMDDFILETIGNVSKTSLGSSEKLLTLFR